ncbi:MAG: DNA replication/repair protein RecF [Vulcanibacillus sp.]
MYINNLQLKNFRNYKELDLFLENKINIFQGNNAQGKTNILEALHLLALAKSHRTSKDKELIKWGNSFSLIKGELKNSIGNSKLELQIYQKGKKVKINNIEKKKLSEYIGKLNVVIFSPEDLNLVKGSPQLRRKFLDIEIGQINPSYIFHLVQYQKIIYQRNNLLKDFSRELKNKLELLELWNIQLIEHGSKIILKRLEYIKQLEKWAEQVHWTITNGKEKLRIKYKPSILLDFPINELEIKQQFKKKIKEIINQEISRGITLIGPHRDDILLYINEIDIQSYGSQGQQRTTALSIKLAEIELINNSIGEYPILLLDDVLSELDETRQTYLLKTIGKKVQTFITTTSINNIDLRSIQDSAIFYVENGKVIKK